METNKQILNTGMAPPQNGEQYGIPIRFKYHKDYEGGFISNEESGIQILDFRKGMGDKYGELIAESLNSAAAFDEALNSPNARISR